MYTMSGGDKGIWLIVHNQKPNACYYCVINQNIYCQVTKRNLSLTTPIMLILSCQSHSLLICMLPETRERKDCCWSASCWERRWMHAFSWQCWDDLPFSNNGNPAYSLSAEQPRAGLESFSSVPSWLFDFLVMCTFLCSTVLILSGMFNSSFFCSESQVMS